MLIIHCAATTPTMNIGVKEIDRWHKQRGFFNFASGLSIGYHYVIRRDGTVEKGRPDSEAGAHAKGYNAHSLGICLVGGIDANGKPENNFTPEQWGALIELVVKLAKSYHISRDKIIGHNQVAAKDCPCFSVPEWIEEHKDIFEKEGIK